MKLKLPKLRSTLRRNHREGENDNASRMQTWQNRDRPASEFLRILFRVFSSSFLVSVSRCSELFSSNNCETRWQPIFDHTFRLILIVTWNLSHTKHTDLNFSVESYNICDIISAITILLKNTLDSLLSPNLNPSISFKFSFIWRKYIYTNIRRLHCRTLKMVYYIILDEKLSIL